MLVQVGEVEGAGVAGCGALESGCANELCCVCAEVDAVLEACDEDVHGDVGTVSGEVAVIG